MAQSTHQNALPLNSMLMEYRLVSVLGAGGFGITYLARDTNLEKDVAIKEYLPPRKWRGSYFPSKTGDHATQKLKAKSIASSPIKSRLNVVQARSKTGFFPQRANMMKTAGAPRT